MEKIFLFKNYPVKAEVLLGVEQTILTAIFRLANPFLPLAKYTAEITGGEIIKPVRGILKKEGDSLYVYCAYIFTKAGEFALQTSLKNGGKSIEESSCMLSVGSFRERLAARLVSDLAGKNAANELYIYALHLLDMGVPNDQVAAELMKCNPCQRKLIIDLYIKYLRREPLDEEWKLMPELPVNIFDTEKLEIFLLSSNEYYKKIGKGSNRGFLSALIADLTGSAIKPPQYNDWLNELDNTEESVVKVIMLVRDLLLTRMRSAASIFEQFYHRKPFGNELKDIIHYAKKGKGGQDGLEVIFNPPTYFQPQGPVEPASAFWKVPDYTFQFFVNLEQANSYAGGKDVRGLMIDSITDTLNGLGKKYDGQLSAYLYTTFAKLIPEQQVWSIPWNGQENGAIWFNSGYNDYSLKVLDPIPPGTAYIFNIKESAIRTLMDKIWAGYPKRLDNNGKPSDSGNTELRNYELSLENNQLSITIYATYHATSVIGIGVSVTYTDNFRLEDGRIVNSTSHKLDYDSGINWIDALNAAIYMTIPFVFAGEVEGLAKLKEPPLPNFSVGAILSSFFPKTILVPGTSSKLFFPYSSLQLIPGDGIKVAGDTLPFLPREPKATITSGSWEIYFPDVFGTYQLIPSTDNSPLVKLKLSFGVVTQDLRGPLIIKWTTDGVLSNQNGNGVDITWQFDPKKPAQRYIKVDVTDMDNIKVTDDHIIHFLGKSRTSQVDNEPNRRKSFRQNE